MTTKRKTEPRWRQRMREIESKVEAIRIRSEPENDTPQDREWCEVTVDGETRRIRFHDYHELFAVPGLYEELFYEHLRCCSPSRVAALLDEVTDDAGTSVSELRVFDLGAGNGMVGDELHSRDVDMVVGCDIIPEARAATFRDRPGVYEDYVVADLTDLPEETEEELRRNGFNCLTSVAALGFGDIPDAAFLNALDLVETPGWLAFNIKEDFLKEDVDQTGFCRLIRNLQRQEIIRIDAYRRYRHRLSITRKPLYYVAMVARKLRDLPDHMLT